MLIASMYAISYASFNGTELQGYNSSELKSMERFDKTFLKNQNKSSELYSKLNDSFGKVEVRKESDYPDYYGGAYINNDGNLVVNLVDNSNGNNQDIEKRIGTDAFIPKSCKYSYKMLTRIMDSLNTYKHQNLKNPICNNFNSYSLLDDQNIIVVYLDNYNQEQIDAFKQQVLDSPAIEFKKAESKFSSEISVNPGSKIHHFDKYGSVGYRAKLNGEIGFVTAGHLVDVNGMIDDNDYYYAICRAHKQSGSVDASFCEITDSSYTPTNTLNGTSNTLSTTISEPGVGTVINKIGYSGGQTSGTILSTNASATDEYGVTYTNLTSADYTSAAGDSGGIIYSYISSTNTRLTLGIHKGASGSTRYYIKANKINSALGTSRY